ncbi:PepSY domain-containing protein [Roseospirillum parvum]|uniref:Peptidase propeptide and YPEB domain-containing protein n=1 Tax=Roseospirillum parvum TaxID=83401 RepID=A0A1G8AJJ7_9PROT|nr:PepSY domain-containing protein [Roseospirillum parvum]SDH20976.1 Peptidase propeptide and YPEB domain-containing protein [Roseospirillum parvum]
MTAPLRPLHLIPLLVALVLAAPAMADDDGYRHGEDRHDDGYWRDGHRGDHGSDHGDDHDRARAAVAEGRARPLADILSAVEPDLPGRVIETELEMEDGRLVYEFTVIARDGRVREVMVDAATAEIVAIEDD